MKYKVGFCFKLFGWIKKTRTGKKGNQDELNAPIFPPVGRNESKQETQNKINYEPNVKGRLVWVNPQFDI